MERPRSAPLLGKGLGENEAAAEASVKVYDSVFVDLVSSEDEDEKDGEKEKMSDESSVGVGDFHSWPLVGICVWRQNAEWYIHKTKGVAFSETVKKGCKLGRRYCADCDE